MIVFSVEVPSSKNLKTLSPARRYMKVLEPLEYGLEESSLASPAIKDMMGQFALLLHALLDEILAWESRIQYARGYLEVQDRRIPRSSGPHERQQWTECCKTTSQILEPPFRSDRFAQCVLVLECLHTSFRPNESNMVFGAGQMPLRRMRVKMMAQ